MSDHPDEQTLTFKDHPIRIVMQDGVPWFSLNDICLAMNRNHYAAEQAYGRNFPEHARRTCSEETEEGELQDATLLSPVGVWLFTHLIDAAKFQQLAAWARKEAKRLCPNPRENDPSMFLTLTPDGELPPYPMKYSGRKAEWLALRGSAEYAQAQTDKRSIVSKVRQRLEAISPSAPAIA